VRVRIVLGVALAVMGVAVVVVLSQRAQRLAGTSFVTQRGFPVLVPAYGRACQPGTYLADDSAEAQLTVGTDGRPRPALTVTFADAGGTVVAHGRAAGGAKGGVVTVPFAHAVEGNRYGTNACVRSAGPHRIALAGDIARRAASARVNGRALGAVVGFRYLRSGRESWWALAPVVAQRFGLGKSSVFGTWTLPLLVVVVVGVWLAAIRLLLREEPR
jgi:hypothetical protein